MILITDVKLENIPEDMVEMFSTGEYSPNTSHWGNKEATMEIVREIVIGRRYKNSRGMDIVIGMDKKTQDILSIPFKDFEEKEEMIDLYYHKFWGVKKKLREIKELKFFGRLKFLFTGR